MAPRIFTESEEKAYAARCAELGLSYRPHPTIPDPPRETTLSKQLSDERLRAELHRVCAAAGVQERHEPGILKKAQELGLRGRQIEELRVLVEQTVKKCRVILAEQPKPPPVKLVTEKEAAIVQVNRMNTTDPAAYARFRAERGLEVSAAHLRPVPLPPAAKPAPVVPETPKLSPADVLYNRHRAAMGLPPIDSNSASSQHWATKSGSR